MVLKNVVTLSSFSLYARSLADLVGLGDDPTTDLSGGHSAIKSKHSAPGLDPDDFGAADEPEIDRVEVAGKFFTLGGHHWMPRGMTYGPFRPNQDGISLPPIDQVHEDFRQIRQMGGTCVRVYEVPPRWLLDVAMQHDLRVFIDVPWDKHRCFFEDWEAMENVRRRVEQVARELGNHPACFAISVVNEFPADLVRFYGANRLADFVDELVRRVKKFAPKCPTTFANYPSTEYLRPKLPDFACFNVYLENAENLSTYIDRLQHIAGNRPLILGEHGACSYKMGEDGQREQVSQQLRLIRERGVAGSFIFSYTDDWHTGGADVEDWAFGLVDRERKAKPSAQAFIDGWEDNLDADKTVASVSVVVCAFNAESTLEDCLESLTHVDYPDYEVIVVDDGSRDRTGEIAERFQSAHPHLIRVIRQDNAGLSVARNVGAEAGRGSVIAYTDADCAVHPQWLLRLMRTMEAGNYVGVGGPNIPPATDSIVAACVAASPGGPSHVMLDDRRAEHVPGCNMAFKRDVLLGIGGFDPQFRQAGDDVDICLRVLKTGGEIGYSHGAMVWHYRRTSAKAYFKQQAGYGRSEAMVRRKHPQQFGPDGTFRWSGFIYGEGATGLPLTKAKTFHGKYGSGPFQLLYRTNTYSLWSWVTQLQWHALALLLLVLSPITPVTGFIAVGMWITTICYAIWQAARADLRPGLKWWARPLIAGFFVAQPVVRTWARFRHHGLFRRLPEGVLVDDHSTPTPKRIGLLGRDLYYQSTTHVGREAFLEQLEAHMNYFDWAGDTSNEWQPHDVDLTGDFWHNIQLRSVSEELGNGKRFTRIRWSVRPSRSGIFVAILAMIPCIGVIGFNNLAGGIAVSAMAITLLTLLMKSLGRVNRAVAYLVSKSAEAAGLELSMPKRR